MKQKHRRKKWGKIGSPHSAKRKRFLARIRHKKRRGRRHNPKWVRGKCVL